jgi:hypothetical protein
MPCVHVYVPAKRLSAAMVGAHKSNMLEWLPGGVSMPRSYFFFTNSRNDQYIWEPFVPPHTLTPDIVTLTFDNTSTTASRLVPNSGKSFTTSVASAAMFGSVGQGALLGHRAVSPAAH